MREDASRNRRKKAYALGHWAEFLAVLMLRLKGYSILARRFRTKTGEIDILAGRGTTIVAVEVKARRQEAGVLESISRKQRKRIENTLRVWLASRQSPQAAINTDLRFDVIGLIGGWRLRHWVDAWRPDE